MVHYGSIRSNTVLRDSIVSINMRHVIGFRRVVANENDERYIDETATQNDHEAPSNEAISSADRRLLLRHCQS
jgi:hypothetical protein